MIIKRKHLSKISILHYVKFIYRSILFLVAAAVYIFNKVAHKQEVFGGYERSGVLLFALFLLFAVEMVLRFFPSKYESMGCQKQFLKNYRKKEEIDRKSLRKKSWRMTLPVAASWVILNAIIALLYFLRVIDWGILVLIALAYAVCDMICILFFCPFQTLMMKNKCCGTCRIYNWDYAMMFTPLIFVRHILAYMLVAMSLILLVRWEILFYRYPERFFEETNESLSCANCQEKLCSHKKQLRSFLVKRMKNLRS